MEMRPAPCTALIEEVAVEQELRGELMRFSSVFYLELAFHGLSERNGVAGPTGTLVSHFASEVESIDVSQVEGLWDFGIRNVL
jgi:hypothetical protein